MKKKIVEIVVCTLFIITTGIPVSGMFNTIKTPEHYSSLSKNYIPSINDLSAFSGPNPGEITMKWNITAFPEPNPVNCSYEFRLSDVQINSSTWDSTVSFDGTFPHIGIETDASRTVHLDFYTNPSDDGTWIILDRAVMQCWLYVTFDPREGDYWSFARYAPIVGATIHFSTYDDTGNQVNAGCGTAHTDRHGHASFITGDLTDDTTKAHLYTFVARWNGTYIPIHGYAIVVDPIESSKQMYVMDWKWPLNQLGHWGQYGGVYHGFLQGVQLDFYVPAYAIMLNDTYVELSLPSQIPPPTGMTPSVPGAMFAFTLEKQDGPFLNQPVVVSLEYPEEMLNQFGGLAETSMRAYIYNETGQHWDLLQCGPLVISRGDHRFTFSIDKFGMFAIAAETDSDDDGLGDTQEQRLGTNPMKYDSDDDGISDCDEIWLTYGDPNDPWKRDGGDQYGSGQNLTSGKGYYIAVRITGEGMESDVSNCVYVQAGSSQNEPPNQPSTPEGPTNGKINVIHTYVSMTHDPEGDNVYYFWDWGDGNYSGWIGPSISGVTSTATHNWSTKGNYVIKVKAKDIYGAESVWSDPLPITMPYSYQLKHLFFEDLFGRFPHAFLLLRYLMGY